MEKLQPAKIHLYQINRPSSSAKSASQNIHLEEMSGVKAMFDCKVVHKIYIYLLMILTFATGLQWLITTFVAIKTVINPTL